MTREDFNKKLSPFFTPVQVRLLDRRAYHDAKYAIYEIGMDLNVMMDMGRDYICSILWDTVDDPCELRREIGFQMSDSARSAMIAQMDAEW